MELSELSKDYEHWAKEEREKGLSYGPADVFITQLESSLAEAREEIESAEKRYTLKEIKEMFFPNKSLASLREEVFWTRDALKSGDDETLNLPTNN